MVFGKQRYYLTMLGPHRGERVVASVDTQDRYDAEKLFGCGVIDEKGFGFNGLYSKEEVLHMFKPGTDIAGTYNPEVASCEKHRDYHKVSTFEVVDQTAYRIKGQERWQLSLNGKDVEFSYIKDVMSGKIEPVSISRVSGGQIEIPKPKVSEQPKPVNNIASFLDAMDETKELEDNLDMLDGDVLEPDFEDDTPIQSEDLPDTYSSIKTERTASKLASDTDYISDFDANFYSAQSKVEEEDDFRKSKALKHLGASTETNDASIGKPLKEQGQSLMDLMKNGFSAAEFHM